MGDLLIKNIDERLLHRLKRRADSHGVSVEEEIKTLLELVGGPENNFRLDVDDDLLALADSIRMKNAHRQQTDSALLIRESREAR